MISSGFDINQPINLDKTLLHLAVQKGVSEAVKKIIEAGADLDVLYHDQTPLMIAAENGLHYICGLLIKAGANYRYEDPDGHNVMSRAISQGFDQAERLRTVQTLLAHGCDANQADRLGRTPLHWSAVYGDASVAECLLEHGAIIDSRNYCGRTPLYLAAFHEKIGVARLLLNAGADDSITDDQGRQPIDIKAISFEMRTLLERQQLLRTARKTHDSSQDVLGNTWDPFC